MTSHSIEKQLEIIINLLENIPSRICDELEKREEIKRSIRMKELTQEMNLLNDYNKNKYGTDPNNYTMDCNNGQSENLENQKATEKYAGTSGAIETRHDVNYWT